MHKALSVHPDVFMSGVKELGYFNNPRLVRSGKAWAAYLENFAGTDNFRYRGESTPHYFWVKDPTNPFSRSPHKHDNGLHIFDCLGPSTKILVVLRHPLSRAISAANHHCDLGRIDRGASILRTSPKLGIVDMGFYKRHLARWTQIFEPSQLKLMLYDALEQSPTDFLRELAGFLSIPADPSWLEAIDFRRVNDRRVNRHRLREHRVYQGCSWVDAHTLMDVYAEDIEHVRSVFGEHVWREDVNALLDFTGGGVLARTTKASGPVTLG